MTPRKAAILLVAGMALTAQAFAACPSEERTVFSCTTTRAKLVEVCDLGNKISYSFGPADKPEISLQVPRARATTRQWDGIGSAFTYSVDIPNGKTVYRVYWAADRMSESHDIAAGVEVIINGKSAATVSCDPGKNIVQQIEGIDLKPTP